MYEYTEMDAISGIIDARIANAKLDLANKVAEELCAQALAYRDNQIAYLKTCLKEAHSKIDANLSIFVRKVCVEGEFLNITLSNGQSRLFPIDKIGGLVY